MHAVCPRLVLQILASEHSRRVWLARMPAKARGYRLVSSPTRDLAHFEALPVWGLACAETPAGRDRVASILDPEEVVQWREVSIGMARRVARRMAQTSSAVVHLALFDEPGRIVWEPVSVSG